MSVVPATWNQYSTLLVVTLSKLLNLSKSVSSPVKWERISAMACVYYEDWIMWCVLGCQEFVYTRHQCGHCSSDSGDDQSHFFLFLLDPFWPPLALWYLLAWCFISRQQHILWSSEQVSRYPLLFLLLAFTNVPRLGLRVHLSSITWQCFEIKLQISALRSNSRSLHWNCCLHSAPAPSPWEGS